MAEHLNELTVNPLNPEESLLGVLTKIRDLQSAPLIPNNPLSQIGAALQGFHAGMTGQANPALQFAQQQRQQALSGLTAEAGLQQASLGIQREKRLEQQKRAELEIGVARDFLSNSDSPAGVKAGFDILKKHNIFSATPEIEQEFTNKTMAKNYRERLDLTLEAIEKGIDPKILGLNTAGINVDVLKGFSSETRTSLMSSDAQIKLAQAAERHAKSRIDTVKAGALERVHNGTASASDRRIAGVAPASPDAVIAEILTEYYGGMTLSKDKQAAVATYLQNNELKGLTGDAQLAMRAALGDKIAAKALAELKEKDRNLNDTTVLLKAAEVKARIRANPAYQPAMHEQALLLAANDILERKQAKPMPQYLTTDLTAIKLISQQLDVIKSIKNPGRFLGIVAGPWGESMEWSGLSHNPERAKLQNALKILFAVFGVGEGGKQFTVPEQKIFQDFVGETKNPSGRFQVKMDAFEQMVRLKHKLKIATAKSNHFQIPDEFLAFDEPTTNQPAVDRAKILLLEGKSQEEVERIMRGHP